MKIAHEDGCMVAEAQKLLEKIDRSEDCDIMVEHKLRGKEV